MSDSTGKRRGKTPKTNEASSATAVVAPQTNTTTSTKKPLPATFKDPDNPEQSRPRYAAGTVVGGRKVGGQPISNEILKAARQGTQPTAQQSQQETTQQQEQLPQERQPSRLQRIGATIARGARVAGALGPMGMIRAINRSAETNTSLFNFAGADAQSVAVARAGGMGFGGGQGGYALSPRAERAIITTSTDTAAVRVSVGRLERTVAAIANKIEADTEKTTPTTKPNTSDERGGGGILGLIGSLFGGIGGLFGGGGAAGLGALLRRGISTIARTIFTKIPIIGPLILVALNIEGAMEEYERNGLGAAITDLLSGIGSDLTFGLVDKDTIKEFINKGIEKVTEWWNTAKDTLMGVIDSVVGGLRDFFGSIGNFFRRAVDDFNAARQRVREASERSEDERLRGLASMQPSPSGSPGQAGARGIASSYDISNRDYGDIQDMLMSPQAGETPEQRAERERLSELQRRQEVLAQSRGGNVQLGEGVAEYLARRRQEEFNRSLSANENQLYADLQNFDPADAFRERSSATTTPAPTAPVSTTPPERVQSQNYSRRVAVSPSTSAELRQQIDSAASTVGQRGRARAGFISDGRVVAIETIEGERIDIPSMGAPEQVPIPPDGRSQSIAAGANEPSVVVVQQPAPASQQTTPPAIPAQGSSRGAATGRAPAPATHPDRPNDVGSAAMGGSR